MYLVHQLQGKHFEGIYSNHFKTYFKYFFGNRYPSFYYQSYLKFHTDVNTRMNPANTNPSITKNCLYLNVFYDDLATTYTSELPAVTAISLFGSVGGNLGLFIGISILTFVELLELFINIILILISKT